MRETSDIRDNKALPLRICISYGSMAGGNVTTRWAGVLMEMCNSSLDLIICSLLATGSGLV